ncbi:GreA/GreB family elongation factor [Alteromonadaceae bacterium BrNp21-10]|nr:GreA/GreB family elongation factor [Alteromonadaceae bacterium BrNp21-10]
MRMFRSGKTLICPSHPIFQEASHRTLMDPIALSLLLNRIEFSDSRISRFEGRVRAGSTVVVKNTTSKEQFKLRIVESEKANPAKGMVSFTSLMGTELLGRRCGEMAKIRTSNGETKWEIVTVNHQPYEF